MQKKIQKHIKDHSKLIENNQDKISNCIKKISNEIINTLKKKIQFFLQEMGEVRQIVNI